MKLVTLTSTLATRFDIFKALEMIKEAGFDGYDYSFFNREWVACKSDGWKEHALAIRKKSDELGLPCLQAHSNCERKMPMEISEEDYLADNIRALEFAAILGCPIVVVHPSEPYTAEQNRDALYAKLMPVAEKLGVKVATENMFSWQDSRQLMTVPSACGTAADFVAHIDALPHPNFTACLDLGHAQMVNCEGAPKMIRALGKRIGALHVHDNDLIYDDHIFPFAGFSNWEEITSALAEIGYSGHFTFEADQSMTRYPDELLPYCLKLLERTGRYLIKRIEDKK